MKKFGIYAIAENLEDLYDVGIYGDEEEDYRCPVLLVGSEAMTSDGEKTLAYSIGSSKDINDFNTALMEEQRRLREMNEQIPDLAGGKRLYLYSQNASAYRNIGYYAYTEDEAWNKLQKELIPDTLTNWDIDTTNSDFYFSKIEDN